MKKMLKLSVKMFVLISVISISAGTAFAAVISVDTAQKVAVNWMNEKTGNTFKVGDVSVLSGNQRDSVTPYYVLKFNTKGWVIVSGDDVAYPVIAYSDASAYSDTSLPPAFEEWMGSVKQQITGARSKALRSSDNPQAKAAWDRLSVSPEKFAPQRDKRDGSVAPLLGDIQWNQSKYYNALCPSDSLGRGSDGHAYAGCVATAMAQVMKYYRYPESGTGSYSYDDLSNQDSDGNTIPYSAYGRQYADFGSTTYNWSAMPDKLSSYNNDVATLLYHVGVSVSMNYGPKGSGANVSYSAKDALVRYFKYDSSLYYASKLKYSDADWINLLKSELNAAHPIIYRGSGTGGHAFVCDGYKDTEYFHFNWGWGGYLDGYFYLNSLTPGSSSFTNDQGGLMGVKPAVAPTPVCTFTISPENQSFGANGGTGTITVNVASGCSWTSTSSASWISIASGSSGNAYGTITYVVEANPTASSRTGTITVAGKTVTITQSGVSSNLPDLIVSSLVVTSFTSNSTGYSVTYDYTIKNVGNAPATLDGPIGEDHKNVSVQAFISADTIFNNAGDIAAGGTILGLSPLGLLAPGESRSGSFGCGLSTRVDTSVTPYLILKVDWGEVLQESNENNNTLAVLLTANRPCSFNISPHIQSFSSPGGSSSISVSTESDCNWFATSNADWITLLGNTGIGNGTLIYSVAPNTLFTPRSGTITIGDKIFTITQEAVSCYQVISGLKISALKCGGTIKIVIQVAVSSWGTDCPPLQIFINVNWLTLTGGSSQRDDTTITQYINVEPNPDPTPRSTTIYVAGQPLTITQEGTESPHKGGVFTVDNTGIVKIDWLYDGGAYKGEFGIFSLTGMENLTPGSSEFIAEAVKRVLANSDQGYLVFSDLSEGARFSGQLGNEAQDWNAGQYRGLKSFAMKPGDKFATILVPDSTFAKLAEDPATKDSHIRPLFSLVSDNPGYGTHIGQMADINGMGKAFAYEDIDAATSDWDFNDLIMQITGADSDLPSIDSLNDTRSNSKQKRDGFSDWRANSELGKLIMAHIGMQSPADDTLNLTVTLKSGQGSLLIYDSQNHVIGKDGGTLIGSELEMKADGSQTVSLGSLNPGDYRIVIRSTEAGTETLEVKLYGGTSEISSQTITFDTASHRTMTTAIPADSLSPDQPITVETPKVPVTAGGRILYYDFNGDGRIDDADTALVTKLWNAKQGSPSYDPFYDFDNDGRITVSDIMKVSSQTPAVSPPVKTSGN